MNQDRQVIWWVLRAQSGDRDALNRLLASAQQPLQRYIFNLVQNQALSEDILQEVFLIIYRKLRWLDEPRLFHAWAYRIAARESWKQLQRERKRSGANETDLDSIPSTPLNFEWNSVARERIPEMLSRVSPASRVVLVLHFLEEMKLAEVASVLDISIGTVKSRLAYGLATLRRLVNEGTSEVSR